MISAFPNRCLVLLALLAWIPAARAQDPATDGARHPQPLPHPSEALADLRLISVPDSPALAFIWNEQRANQMPRSWFSISLDGDTFTAPKESDSRVLLRFAEFDPLQTLPAIPPALTRPAGSSLHIVQFWTQGIEPYRETLRNMGVRLHLFLANHAHVVGMSEKQAELVRSLPFVRWVGPFHVAYKFEEGLASAEHPAWDAGPSARFNILTMERGMRGQEPVSQFITASGATVQQTTPQTFLMSATLTRDQLLEVARLDHVQWIDLWGEPEHDMDIARQMHGSDYVEALGDYRGQGVQVEVLDGGCDKKHPDLKNFKEHGPNSPGSHGTSTAGIICGSGGMELRGGLLTVNPSRNWAARGVMPLAKLVIADYAFLGNRYTHTQDLQAKPYRCVLQSNSWGDPRTKAYTSISQQMDLILFDFPRISILQSQSNAGDQMSRPQAWAKNIIAVGGIRHQNTLTKNDDTWNGGASIGPAADGRIKPDLASYYDNILTTTSGGGYTSGFGGTSGATPIIAGHLGLFYEMWSDGIFGNSAPKATVFANRPQNTTAKAVLINTASQWTFTGQAHDLTRVHQGWGHADLQTMYDLRDRMLVIDETDVLTETASTDYIVSVDGTGPLKVTMVYRDWPGTTSSSQHRVNDLDLMVTDPAGTVYWGNRGLKSKNWSSTGGSANTKDTVENVFIQMPMAGKWKVTVIASELNQDTHVETKPLDADYALVISGITPGP
jgi:hypothetical protein